MRIETQQQMMITKIITILMIIKVKVSHNLVAVGAVGLESHCILGTADERRSPSLSFHCLILPEFEKGTHLLLG